MCAVLCAAARTLLLAALVLGQQSALRCRHERCRHNDNDYTSIYEVDGHKVEIYLTEYCLTMNCGGASVLESPALPSVEPAQRVPRVELRECPLPAAGAGSLAASLAALNVTLECSGEDAGDMTLERLPVTPPLAADHFAGLECLVSLRLFGDERARPTPERDFLAPLKNLRSLNIWRVILPTDKLDVPSSLHRIDLDVDRIDQLPVVPALKSLRLGRWVEPQPAPLADCDALRELRLFAPEMTALPDGWLANCSRLEKLDISQAFNLASLPPKLLAGGSALTHLTFWVGTLKTLPASLLAYSPNLHMLRLCQLGLRTLPSDMFAVARRVSVVDLSSNKLESGAMAALATLEDLTELNLGHNPSLGDVCGADSYSPIRNSMQLRKLLLEQTGVTRVCRDWQHDMTLLEMLDLSSTKISELSFENLQFNRTVEAEVVLRGVSLTALEMSREEYAAAGAARGRPRGAAVRLESAARLPCDCRMYWTRRALDLSLPALRDAAALRCADGRPLRDVPPEAMECARPAECAAAALPAGCACSVWRADHPTRDPRLVRVRCERAGLYSVPRPRAADRLYELRLAHNHIADLQADDVLTNIQELDLRNNSLREVDEETARRLGDIVGPLHLAGNPLECSCRAAPLLRALHARNATRTDLSAATCSDGSPLGAAAVAECPPDAPAATPLGTWLAVGLAVLLALALAAVAWLASRERRFFARAVLHRWGVEWRAAEPEDDGRRYDAFITFSHKDEAVVRELAARLEPQHRLCIHERDWTPGCFISEQVVESVRESRRTVALVSRHFLASAWARAEFREAHAAAMLDARPRLVVVLLEEPAALQMDAQLRRYVATQTYLRWGDPWFWDKLAVALPRPRAHHKEDAGAVRLDAAAEAETLIHPAVYPSLRSEENLT